MWRSELPNGRCGISSRALAGRTSYVAKLTQGIARARSALGCILAAFQAALGLRQTRTAFFYTETPNIIPSYMSRYAIILIRADSKPAIVWVRSNGPLESSPGLSEVMPWVRRYENTRPERAREV
jgi:hypothetical protein